MIANLVTIRSAVLAVSLLSAAALTLLAFQGWVQHGPAILLTLMETGLSYCF